MRNSTPNNDAPSYVVPDWPAPPSVRAATTTRHIPDGLVLNPEFNLAVHGDEDPARVQINRDRLIETLELPAAPVWLEQVHGCEVVRPDREFKNRPRADAAATSEPNTVCAVLTADCLPVLLCDRDGTEVAAVHGGWRGLQRGIIDRTLESMAASPSRLLAWLGPAISAQAYEIDETVYRAFADWDVELAFTPTRPGHWQLDLYAVARRQLNAAGVTAVYGGQYCTYSQPELFFSYRRDRQTGRMASLIWIDPVFE